MDTTCKTTCCHNCSNWRVTKDRCRYEQKYLFYECNLFTKGCRGRGENCPGFRSKILKRKMTDEKWVTHVVLKLFSELYHNVEVCITAGPRPQNRAREPRYDLRIEGPKRLIRPLATWIIDGVVEKRRIK